MKPEKLIQQAQELIRVRYCREGHHAVVAAALVTTSGHVYTALNVGTTQPSVATCAEIIAIGMAHRAEPDMAIDMIVAVRDPAAYVISPCGKCREYIADYGPTARVIVPADNPVGYEVVAIGDLLPNKYEKKVCVC